SAVPISRPGPWLEEKSLMQGEVIQRSFTDWKLKIFLLGSCLLLVSWMGAPSAEAQSGANFSQATISGSILVEGMEQPAASVRVNIRPLTGGPPVTAYTDS